VCYGDIYYGCIPLTFSLIEVLNSMLRLLLFMVLVLLMVLYWSLTKGGRLETSARVTVVCLIQAF